MRGVCLSARLVGSAARRLLIVWFLFSPFRRCFFVLIFFVRRDCVTAAARVGRYDTDAGAGIVSGAGAIVSRVCHIGCGGGDTVTLTAYGARRCEVVGSVRVRRRLQRRRGSSARVIWLYARTRKKKVLSGGQGKPRGSLTPKIQSVLSVFFRWFN